MLRVLADILHAVDTGDLSILALLDLSAAFDTVDHDILIQRLQTSFGVVSVACKWFRSYLTGRVQCVDPPRLILYTADLITLIEDFGSGGACFPPRWCELLVGRGPPPYRCWLTISDPIPKRLSRIFFTILLGEKKFPADIRLIQRTKSNANSARLYYVMTGSRRSYVTTSSPTRLECRASVVTSPPARLETL